MRWAMGEGQGSRVARWARVDRCAALAAALAGDHAPLRVSWADDDGAAVAATAVAHKVPAAALAVVRQAGLAGVGLTRLEHESRRVAGQSLAVLAAAREVGTALDGAGLRWVVLKGPVLQELCWGPTPRECADLDVLVDGVALGPAIDALVGAGGHLVERNWDRALAAMTNEVHVVLRSGVVVDLHWHLVSSPDARRRFRVDPAAVLTEAGRVGLGGREAPVPSPPHLALHVALHAAQSGARELRWLVDVDRAVVAAGPRGWPAIVEVATAWRIGLPVGAVVEQARRLLGTDVPDDAMRALLPNATGRTVARALARRGLADGRDDDHGIAAAAHRALRDDLPATGAALAGMLLRATKRVAAPPWKRIDPASVAHPHHVLRASGGAGGRQRYLDAVAASMIAP